MVDLKSENEKIEKIEKNLLYRISREIFNIGIL